MLNKKSFIGIIIFAIIIFFNALFIVRQTQQALILQFGDPIRIIQKPGLNIKIR